MKHFTKTAFFRLVKDNTQPSDLDLERGYDEFARYLFAGACSTDRTSYHDALVYICAELVSLAEVSGKKYSNIPSKSHWNC